MSLDRGAQPLARWELLSAIISSGAIVMLVEILGTRIIGPMFGVSLFVWAALLSVTLCALAVGYFSGGVLVDRKPHAALLGWVLLLGGAALAAVPVLTSPILIGVSGLGPRLGPLVAALVLFAPVLVVLGTTGPIAVRLATTDLTAAGRRVGNIYAISTAGSLAGTLATSFWLIPSYDTDHIAAGGSAGLVALGATILLRRGRSAALAAFLVPLLVLFSPKPQLPSTFEVRARTSSLYGLVEVIDDTSHGVRYLRADHSVIGAHYLQGQVPAFAFLHALEVLPVLRPNAKDLLVIGLGTGAVPSALARVGIRADVVEIDPAVVRYAEQYFAFTPTGKTYIEDARTLIRTTPDKYDLIVHDTFTGGSTPEHLLSVEVLRQLHQILRPGGVLALNMVGFQEGSHAAATWAVARTLRAEFASVRAFRDSPKGHRPNQTTNILFFASDDGFELSIPPGFRFNDGVCERILPALRDWEILQDVPAGDIITDERNPLGRLQLAVAEEHYDAMNKLLPLEVWIR